MIGPGLGLGDDARRAAADLDCTSPGLYGTVIARSSSLALVLARGGVGELRPASASGRARRRCRSRRAAAGPARPTSRARSPCSTVARRVVDVDGRPRADHVADPHPPDRDLDVARPRRRVLPVLRHVERVERPRPRVSSGSERRRPRGVGEDVEVARLPVQRLLRDHAHDLVAVARPRDRPVGLRPREAHRVVGPEALGERAVVEPRLAAIGRRRDRQRAEQRQRDQPGHARARAAAAAARARGRRRSAPPGRARAAATTSSRPARPPARRRRRTAPRAPRTGSRGRAA